MEGNFNAQSVLRFLQQACRSRREMQAVSVEAMLEAGSHMRLLTKLNDKGLLLLMLTKILAHKFAELPQILKLFIAELFPVERQPRARRPPHDGETKRRKKRAIDSREVDLNELSNESLSNPVGVVAAAGEARGREGEAEEASRGSKPSQEGEQPQPPLDSTFPEVFTEMEQQLAAERESNPDHPDNSQTTSSSANSNRFGAIPNFNKKMEIVGDIRLQERTVRRPRPPPAAGRRTRKKESVIDVVIDLEETAASLNDSLDMTVEALRTRHNSHEEHAHFCCFRENLQEVADRIRSNIFSEENRVRLMRFARRSRPQRGGWEAEVVQQATDYTDQTSYLPQSTLFEQPDSAYRDHLDSNIFQGDERVTLAQLQHRVKKPKWEVFQNLLWLAQQGEVTLEQASPEAFGEITVTRERRELA